MPGFLHPWIRSVFLASILVAAATLSCRAECLPSTRAIAFPDGSARIKTYACSLPGSKDPRLQIEVDRLSESAAGSLVENTPYPDVTRALAVSRVVKNPVFAEAKHLFDAYGTKALISSCYKTAIEAAAGGKSFTTDRSRQVCNEKRTLWYFTFPDQENLTTRYLALPKEEAEFQSTTHWPRGWQFFYADCEHDHWIECTTIWRPARAADVDEFLARVREEEQRDGVASGPGHDDATIEPAKNDDRYFALVKHLNAAGWRDDFLTVTGYAPVCGDGIIFAMHIRQLALDTALIRNVSAAPIALDGLFGTLDEATGLRTSAEAGRAGTAGLLPDAPTMLAPGEAVAVPLRILFLPAGGVDAVFESGDAHHPIDLPAAEKDYKAIAALPAGTLIRPDGAENGKGGKLKESFGPPSVPPQPAYVWGPAYDLKGFTASGQRVALDTPARNFLTIAAGDGYGSCPYLYVFDDTAKDWVWRGKIIHNASSPAKAMTQTIALPGLSTRFSIREEELEVSTIRAVALTLDLSDGRTLRLDPRSDGGPSAAGTPVVITAGRSWDFAFDLPPGVDAAEVRQSTLSVTGYYRPYSSLAAEVAPARP